ncbi:hypothetical protein H4R21_006856, partial [Coemansia helicoidea]
DACRADLGPRVPGRPPPPRQHQHQRQRQPRRRRCGTAEPRGRGAVQERGPLLGRRAQPVGVPGVGARQRRDAAPRGRGDCAGQPVRHAHGRRLAPPRHV